ncbi:general secretion pathway protein GspA [Halieaceae bacterium IMCC14734]|uniref:General secretion pathway protein GspA n=1 Tax=Candidatus Litorirhabdus singularis TaxID=2518993 RepID=A0ABT3TJJ8_9GAMM|nr:AAA family ATPase [Candidatus Litorirhabdus singularis]MCX2982174.1 general secretion pathway protein GspA [Candidatus Litorirhabdus singularis]
MYHNYFGLEEQPFSIAVNPRYLFMSARHRDALAHLLYGVGSGGGFVLLTGEVGTGKTTINRCLLEQLPSKTDIAIILNPALNAEELLASVCDELGIAYDASATTLKTLTDLLHEYLLANHQRGRNTVLLIDEAQHLQFDVLEQIRLLTNLETNTQKLLQIILVGQPELSALLAKPELRQLSQRITARYDLQPLNRIETDAYIMHRLQVAGLPATQRLFSSGLVSLIHRSTRGIPRLINVVCDRALLGAYGQGKPCPDRRILKQAITEVMGEQLAQPQGITRRWPLAAALVSAAMLAGVLLVVIGYQQPPPSLIPASTRTAIEPTPAPAVAMPVAIPAAALPEPWYSRESSARTVLAAYVGAGEFAANDVCAALSTRGWRCESAGAETWDDVLKLQRPVLLSLVTAQRFNGFAVLIGVQAQQARLLHSGREVDVALARLGPLWTGEYMLIWQPPPGYSSPLALGDSSPTVAWLAQQFARLDGQQQPLTELDFTAALDTRVRLFQRQSGLRDDGVVGLQTLLKLQSVTVDVVSLERAGADSAPSSVRQERTDVADS